MSSEKKRILSWDVGIKNLAYCQILKENDTFKIEKWGVINLSENEKVCCYTTKTGSVCGKNARFNVINKDDKKFLHFSEKTSFYTCKLHSEKFEPSFWTLSKVHKCLKCGADSYKGLKGNSNEYSWCKIHYEKGKEKTLKQIKFKKIGVTSCTKQPIQLTANKLYNILDENQKDFLNVSEVLIENQPSLKNPSMKTISALLLGYFVIRGISEKDETDSNIEFVRFISPSNKLKINNKTTTKVLKKGKEDNKVYKMTKKLGVKYCQSLISKEDNKILEKYKKKDDLCDAFLQGFQYLFSPVPEKYMEKLRTVGLEEVITKSIKSLY